MPDRRFPLVTLVVLDGWGLAPPGPGNAVELASTPVFDDLWATYPHTSLAASGEAVGLPPGQMGNSEVGHLTIGSGRVLFQDLMRVNLAVRDGSIFENPALVGAFERARERGGDVHLLGLVSQGGVHSHIDHLLALLELAERHGMADRTWIHAFTDGRDVSPHAAVGRPRAAARRRGSPRSSAATTRWTATTAPSGRSAPSRRSSTAWARLPSIRSPRWRRATRAASPTSSSSRSCSRPARGSILHVDAAIFFNFRPDRGRQLSRRLLERGVDLTTMTRYAEDIPTPVAFPGAGRRARRSPRC